MIDRNRPVEIVFVNQVVEQVEIINDKCLDDGILVKRIAAGNVHFYVFNDDGEMLLSVCTLESGDIVLRNKKEPTKKEKMQKLLNELQELIAKDE